MVISHHSFDQAVPTLSIRGPVHSVVVDADQMTVLRSLHVELEAEPKICCPPLDH